MTTFFSTSTKGYIILGLIVGAFIGLIGSLSVGIIAGMIVGIAGGLITVQENNSTIDYLDFKRHKMGKGIIGGVIWGLWLIGNLNIAMINATDWTDYLLIFLLLIGLRIGFGFGMCYGMVYCISLFKKVMRSVNGNRKTSPASHNLFFGLIIIGLIASVIIGLISKLDFTQIMGLIISNILGSIFGLLGGLSVGLLVAVFSGLTVDNDFAIIQQYILQTMMHRRNYFPFHLTIFLDHCVDLIFLRRVGGGYIFVHRLLMEHFAEMYVEPPTSKGNQI